MVKRQITAGAVICCVCLHFTQMKKEDGGVNQSSRSTPMVRLIRGMLGRLAWLRK